LDRKLIKPTGFSTDVDKTTVMDQSRYINHKLTSEPDRPGPLSPNGFLITLIDYRACGSNLPHAKNSSEASAPQSPPDMSCRSAKNVAIRRVLGLYVIIPSSCHLLTH